MRQKKRRKGKGWPRSRAAKLVKSEEAIRTNLARKTARTLTYFAARLDGGKESFVSYVRAAVETHPHLQPFLDHYDSITNRERQDYSLDTLAVQANVTGRALIEAVAGEAYEQGVNAANLIAAHSFPDVVSRSVKTAKTVRGVKDREFLMQHHGFLPVPKGSTVNVQMVTNIKGGADDFAPSFEATVIDLGDSARQVEQGLGTTVETENVKCTINE